MAISTSPSSPFVTRPRRRACCAACRRRSGASPLFAQSFSERRPFVVGTGSSQVRSSGGTSADACAREQHPRVREVRASSGATRPPQALHFDGGGVLSRPSTRNANFSPREPTSACSSGPPSGTTSSEGVGRWTAGRAVIGVKRVMIRDRIERARGCANSRSSVTAPTAPAEAGSDASTVAGRRCGALGQAARVVRGVERPLTGRWRVAPRRRRRGAGRAAGCRAKLRYVRLR